MFSKKGGGGRGHIGAAQNNILALIACVRVHGLSHTLKQNYGHT